MDRWQSSPVASLFHCLRKSLEPNAPKTIGANHLKIIFRLAFHQGDLVQTVHTEIVGYMNLYGGHTVVVETEAAQGALHVALGCLKTVNVVLCDLRGHIT